MSKGIVFCLLCVCFYVFVALPKILQGKPVSCLFEDKLNNLCRIELWKSNSRTKFQNMNIDKTHNKISLQDTEFVVNKPEKEGLINFFTFQYFISSLLL